MDDRSNTIAGWVLAGGIAALGLSIIAGKIYHADHPERPEEMAYVIQGVETEGEEESGPPFAALLAQADAAAGANIFKKCVACHTIEAGGANGIGPNLHGVMGEAVASSARGFAFSDALQGVGGEWTFEKMSEWIASPRKFAPGTKMTFAGISDAQDRANLLVYLNGQGSNVPLPPVPEPAAEDEAAAAADVEGAAEAGEEAAEGQPVAGEEAEPTVNPLPPGTGE